MTCPCDHKTTISQAHILSCPAYQDILERFVHTSQTSGALKKLTTMLSTNMKTLSEEDKTALSILAAEERPMSEAIRLRIERANKKGPD